MMMSYRKRRFKAIFFGGLLGVLAWAPVVAEDIEVFITATKPNVVLVLDRFLPHAIDPLLEHLSNANVGMMAFKDKDSKGPGVIHPVVDIDVPANRQSLIEAADAAQESFPIPRRPSTFTGSFDSNRITAYLEAYRYYSGGPVEFGVNSVAEAKTTDGANYISPIKHQCQKNHMVYMRWSREPPKDPSKERPKYNTIAEKITNTQCSSKEYYIEKQSKTLQRNCEDALAYYMYREADLSPILSGTQNVQTHEVDYRESSNEELEQTPGEIAAKRGGGRYYYLSPHYKYDGSGKKESTIPGCSNCLDDKDVKDFIVHTEEQTKRLLDSFEVDAGEFFDGYATFTTPTVSVNPFNQKLNRKFLYYTVFSPTEKPRWEGNVKKYQLVFDDDGTASVGDADGSVAIDPDTGKFKSTAKSFWNPTSDGDNALIGGVRDRLTDAAIANNRNVWTDVEPTRALSSNVNTVNVDNTGLSEEVVRWIRGFDVSDEDEDGDVDESRRSIADPLHSKPVLVNYAGTATAPEQVLFFTTNNGHLHAIDEETGDEIFTYIPEELFSIQPLLFRNPAQEQEQGVPRPYGLDSPVRVWVNDANKNGTIEDGDHVYIYFGMRRGGNNYYALDVTDIKNTPASATLLWKIVDGNIIAGASGTTSTDAPYALMGQTWSQPVVRKIAIGGTEKTVLVVGGGYDVNQDTPLPDAQDTMGNALYFINAHTGEREWWASNTDGANLTLGDMSYSIPSQLAVYDLDNDGLMERLYVGDMGGQLWRFDVANGETRDSLVTGGVIASLAEIGEEAHARRFYYPPDVALVVEPAGGYLSVVLGSGYRAHPRNTTIQERIYLLRDRAIFSPPQDENGKIAYKVITESDLFDATENTVGESTGDDLQDALSGLAGADGWYITLAKSEKSLAKPLILGGVAMVPVYSALSDDPCDNRLGKNAMYYINLSDATPVYDFHKSGDDKALTKLDRKQEQKIPGILSAPAYIVTGEGNAVLNGPEVTLDPTQGLPVKTYWYKKG